jgi:hypothetical protein
MMIKEWQKKSAYLHVSRAVASTPHPRGYRIAVFLLRSVRGPEGGNTSLLILKRREEADRQKIHPGVDREQLPGILQSQAFRSPVDSRGIGKTCAFPARINAA